MIWEMSCIILSIKKMVGEAMPEVWVLCPDSTLGVSNLGGVFSALLQIDQSLRSPWESPH